MLNEKNGVIVTQYEHFQKTIDNAFKKTDFEMFAMKLEETYYLLLDSIRPQTTQKERILVQQQACSKMRALCQTVSATPSLSDISAPFLADFGSMAGTEEDIQKLDEWVVSLLSRGVGPRGFRASPRVSVRRAAELHRGPAGGEALRELEELGELDGLEVPCQNILPLLKVKHVNVWGVVPTAEKRGLSGKFDRMLCIIGENGRVYTYKHQDCIDLKTGLREWLHTQLLHNLTGVLDSSTLTRSRDISFNIPAIAQLSPTSWLRNVPGDAESLWEMHCAACPEGVSPHTPRSNSGADNGWVTRHLLLTKAKTWDDLFEVRRCVRQGIAAHGAFNYLLGVPAPRPQEFVISVSKKIAYVTEALPYYNEGEDQKKKVPFRFTPALQEITGEPGGHGALNTSLTAVFFTLGIAQRKIEDAITMYYRDDHPCSVLWSGSEGGANSEATLVGSQKFFLKMAGYANVCKTKAINRLLEVSDTKLSAPDRVLSTYVRVEALCAEATNRKNLSEMSPSWCQWL